jgi:hypothetical protein
MHLLWENEKCMQMFRKEIAEEEIIQDTQVLMEGNN